MEQGEHSTRHWHPHLCQPEMEAALPCYTRGPRRPAVSRKLAQTRSCAIVRIDAIMLDDDGMIPAAPFVGQAVTTCPPLWQFSLRSRPMAIDIQPSQRSVPLLIIDCGARLQLLHISGALRRNPPSGPAGKTPPRASPSEYSPHDNPQSGRRGRFRLHPRRHCVPRLARNPLVNGNALVSADRQKVCGGMQTDAEPLIPRLHDIVDLAAP